MLKVQESLKLCSTRELQSDIIGGSYRVSLLVVLPSTNEVAERKSFQKRVSRILSMVGCAWGRAWRGGACMAGGMHGRGPCMAGVCMAGDMAGCVCGRGVCMVGGMCGGGMHGRGRAWQGACMAGGVGWGMCGGGMYCGGHAWHGGVCGEGACIAGDMATAADGMHPTGMHSCAI